jgi:hypothetical protein
MSDTEPNTSEHDMGDQKRAELLLDHYNETFNQILFHWKGRNRIFLFILILLAGICIDLYKPQTLSNLANAYLQKQLSLELTGDSSPPLTNPIPNSERQPSLSGQISRTLNVDFRVIGSVVWFVLLCSVITYYQRSIHVDRQYRYVAEIEDHLNQLLGKEFITREGKSYLSRTGVTEPATTKKRPVFLRAIGYLYTLFFPIALMLLGAWKVVSDWNTRSSSWGFFAINTVLAGALILYNGFYLLWRFRKV